MVARYRGASCVRAAANVAFKSAIRHRSCAIIIRFTTITPIVTAVLLQRKGAYRSATARAFVELALAQGRKDRRGKAALVRRAKGVRLNAITRNGRQGRSARTSGVSLE